jgi:antirestriction protein ArdC
MPKTGLPYENIIVLWLTAEAKGYSNPIWMTFRQAAALDGQVRRGEKSTLVTYADKLKRKDAETGEEKEIFFQKAYPVFNVGQVDGLPAHFYAVADTPKSTPLERSEALDAFVQNTGADIRHGGNRAYYAEKPDYIQMPPFDTFEDTAAYGSTILHEAVHWTKHPNRLDRDFGRKKFSDEGYSQEEIVAELAACFLAADLGLEMVPREEHAAYLDNWLKAMKADKRFIFQSATHAQRAADYLHGLQPEIETATEIAVPDEEPTPPPALPEPEPPPQVSFVERERKRRQARKVEGQTELF